MVSWSTERKRQENRRHADADWANARGLFQD
jgi:hypothetical protein